MSKYNFISCFVTYYLEKSGLCFLWFLYPVESSFLSACAFGWILVVIVVLPNISPPFLGSQQGYSFIQTF